jgi:hypothetical protein
MSAERTYYEHLQSVMLATRGARFNAATSLEWQELVSVITTSILTIYLLSWSVITISFPGSFQEAHVRFYSVVSIIASVALLVVTLMEFALKRAVKAEKLQQNAHCISKLMRDLERELAAEKPNLENLRSIAASYEDEIAQTHINHSTRDWRKWKFSRANSDNGPLSVFFWGRRVVYNARYLVGAIWYYVMLLIAVIAPTVWYTYAIVFSGAS